VAQYFAAGLLVVAGRHGKELAGRTIGVVGVGNVGSRVCRVAQGLGLRVLKNDPPLARATGDPSYLPLDALLDADIVTLHVPLTDSGPDPTYHLFDRARLRALKRGALLVNTARGAVVEGAAFLDALRTGHLVGAIVDTWEHEPTIETQLLLASTIGTPHVAGYSLDGKLNAARMVFEAISRHFGLNRRWYFEGELPAPRVDVLDVGELPQGAEPALRVAVTACYDIEADDAALRELAGLPEEQRASHFRKLRSSYPVRREFSATRLRGTEKRPDVAEGLRRLGFTDDEMPPWP
jgi:erythronate-4-phosphate dehydrogenase